MKTPSFSQVLAPRWRFFFFAAIYIGLWLGTWYSARLLDSLGVVSLWYLPAGLRFCNLLVFGRRGFLLEVIVQLVFLVIQLLTIDPLPAVLSEQSFWMVYNLAGSLLVNAAVIFPLRRWLRDRLDLTRPAHSALFLAAALAASLSSALVGTFRLLQQGYVPADQGAEVLAKWVIGDFIGIITLVPLLLVRLVPGLLDYLQRGHWHRAGNGPSGKRRSDQQVLLIVVLALLLVFGLPWHFGLNLHLPLLALLLLLPLAGVVLRHGLRTAVLAVALLDGGLVLLIAFFDQQGQALHYQIVMMAIALVGLWLGGAVEARNRSMARYQDFSSVSNDLLWEADAQGRLIEASGRMEKHIVLKLGAFWRELLSGQAQSQLTELDEALAQRCAFRHLQIALRGTGDTPLWVQINGLPLFDESGVFAGYRGTAVDISNARQAEALLRNYNEHLRLEVAERTKALRQTNKELATKEQHLQVLLAAAPVGVLELDDEQRCRYINVNGCLLTGCTQDEAQRFSLLDFVHPDDREHVKFVWQINRHSEAVQWLEFRLNRTELRCVAHWIRRSSAEPEMDGAIMVLTNATARSQQDERLWTLAHHDALTDLPNRNLFWDRMRQALRHAKRHESGAALLWLDLDGFKSVNDLFGHAAGDALLQQVGQRLKGRVRDSDTVARMGGDEFAVIMPDIMDAEGALQTAGKLLAGLAEPFDLPQGQVLISGSIGVALYPQHADSVESLTQCADMAMYAAKNAGKNQALVWHDE